MVVQLRIVIRNEHDYVLMPARVRSFSFCHGKRRIVYRLCDESKNVGVLYGKDEGMKHAYPDNSHLMNCPSC